MHGNYTLAPAAPEKDAIESRWSSAILLCGLVVLLGVGLRLYRFTDPIPGWHAWRQYDTAAVARNFHQESMNILYPRVDWRGLSPGYVESEFQIYTFSIATLYRIFGMHEWLARLFNLGVYGISVLLLFRLACRLFDRLTALFTAFFYSIAPLTVFSTHSFQPDALMSVCSLAAIYYFLDWTENQRTRNLVLSALGFSLAVLIKPLSLYLGLPLLYLAYRRFGWQLFRQPAIWLFWLGAVLPGILWYWHALGLWKSYGNTFGVLAGHVKVGPWSLTDSRWVSLGYRLVTRLIYEIATPAGFLFLLYGLFLKPLRRNYVLYWWALAFAITFVLTPAAHRGHDYYQLPLVFVTAGFMGVAAARIWTQHFSLRWAVAVLCVAALATGFWQIRPMVAPDSFEWTRVRFGARVDAMTEPGSLMVYAIPRLKPFRLELYQHRTAEGELLPCDPEDLYLSRRKGWIIDGVQATPEFLETLSRRGARYFATMYPEVFQQSPALRSFLESACVPLEVTPGWVLYKLDAKPISVLTAH